MLSVAQQPTPQCPHPPSRHREAPGDLGGERGGGERMTCCSTRDRERPAIVELCITSHVRRHNLTFKSFRSNIRRVASGIIISPESGVRHGGKWEYLRENRKNETGLQHLLGVALAAANNRRSCRRHLKEWQSTSESITVCAFEKAVVGCKKGWE